MKIRSRPSAIAKRLHLLSRTRALYKQMNKNGHTPQGLDAVDYAAAAIEQMDMYCTANPKSPSAMRRPKLFVRSDLWIALLGPNIEEGIVGIGPVSRQRFEPLTHNTWPGCLTRRLAPRSNRNNLSR